MSPDSREAEVSYGNRTLPGSRESGDEANIQLSTSTQTHKQLKYIQELGRLQK